MNTPHTIARPIRVLPPTLRNQIAAGEVVERPASVLKELVENSLDAGASDIQVSLEDGGLTLLTVRDNGQGIPEADLELAVTRHATSKVASFTDLLHVASYGFRGEALSSIGSVADLRVESVFCPDSASDSGLEGASIRVCHGAIERLGASGLHHGTLVEVRDLFVNVPARLKFIKSPATEMKRCQEYLMKLALARSDVSFSLKTVGNGNKKNERLRLEAGQSLYERLSILWPPQIVKELRPFSGERSGIALHGLASLPQSSQPRGDRILLYANKRPIHNRLLLQAIRTAYKNRLTSREYPQVVLFLELNAGELDVNVHPAKSEVRFRDEKAVFNAVLNCLRNSLDKHSPNMSAERPVLDAPLHMPPLYAGPYDFGDKSESVPDNWTERPLRPEGALPLQEHRQIRPQGFWGSLDQPRLLDKAELQGGEPSPEREDTSISPDEEFPPLLSETTRSLPRESQSLPLDSSYMMLREEATEYQPHRSVHLSVPFPGIASQGGVGVWPGADNGFERPSHLALPLADHQGGYPVAVGSVCCLGQVADTYLVLTQGDALLLMDQHAAHERVLLHKIRQQTESSQSQLLALPVELPLHPSEEDRFQELFSQLVGLGFSLALEGHLLRVSGVPPLLGLIGKNSALAFLRDCLAGRTDGMENLLHVMACRSAIKAGQHLTADEAVGLLTQWLQTPDRLFCPHGRPTLLAFDKETLEKMFKRKIG